MNKELEHRIKEELNIDISTYRNDDAVEQITDLILFPKYALQWILLPFLLFMILFVLGFWIFDIGTVGVVIYCTVGLILFGITGLLAGLYYFTFRLEEDVQGIMNYSLGITQQGLRDVKQMGTHLSSAEKGNAIKLLFLGVTQLVTIPSISAAVRKKVPIIGPVVSVIVSRIVMAMSGKVELAAENAEELEHDTASDKIDQVDNETRIVTTGSSKVLTKTIKLIRLPIRILLFVSAIVLGIFIWLIN